MFSSACLGDECIKVAIALFAWSIQNHEDPIMWSSSPGDDVEDVENGHVAGRTVQMLEMWRR
jgi:hypothetical protein